MNFEFSPEQEQLRESVRRFLEETAPIAWVREQLDGDRGTTDAVWGGLAELGLLGLLVPEECGGAGLGMLEMGVVLEEMGRAVHPGPFLASAVGATRLLAEGGSAEDRAELLPSLAEGTRVAALAVHEAASRDLMRPAASAAQGGNGWRVCASKVPVLDASACDWLIVTATADSQLGLFLVDREAAGVDVIPRQSVDGTRKQATVELRDAPARRLGGADPRAALASAADAMAVGLAVDGVGAASRALELAIAYAIEREQFGVPIGSFQAIKHLLVDMLRDVELARAGTYYALWSADANSAGERRRAVSMAKAFTSEELPRIGADAIQVFAGVGFTWEYDVHLYYKRLLSLRHCWGDAREHLDELARMVVDAPQAP